MTEKIQMITITPDMAKLMLEKNRVNRKLSPQTVESYELDIKSGNWKKCYQPIIIGKDGWLQDGQHRLTAIVNTGIPMQCLVVFYADDVMDVIDIGRPRTILDNLKIRNPELKYATCKKSIARQMFLRGTGIKKPSFNMISEFLKYNSEILHETCLTIGSGCQKGSNIGTNKSGCGVAVFCFLKANGISYSGKLKNFFVSVNNGFINDDSESSAIVFRNYLIDMIGKNGDSYSRELCCVAERAIADYVNGVKRKKRYDTSIVDSETFCQAVSADEVLQRYKRSKEKDNADSVKGGDIE